MSTMIGPFPVPRPRRQPSFSPRLDFLAVLLVLSVLMGCGQPISQKKADTAPTTGTTSGRTQSSSAGTLIVQITGQDFDWHICYRGPDGEFGTADDVVTTQNLHLPEKTKIQLRLQSWDYLYTLALPHLGLKEIAVPDLTFCLDFRTESAGAFPLVGDQFCGYAHPNLLGTMTVHSQLGFQRWLTTTNPKQAR